MLFIGEATVFSSVPISLLGGDVTGANLRTEKNEESGALKLKNPRTSVGAGAFDWAEFLVQPATAPGLISPRPTTRTTRSTTAPDTAAELPKAVAARKVREAGAAVIDP
jgi:hypothetical protein